MPGFDGTGPANMGPMTGGGRGFCNPSRASYGPMSTQWAGYSRDYGRARSLGRGAGFGRSRGFGWRGFSPPAGGWVGPAYGTSYGSPYSVPPKDEIRTLKNEAKYIKDELDAINKRIEELQTEASEK